MQTAEDPWRISWDVLSARAWAELRRAGPIPPEMRKDLNFYHHPRVRLTFDSGGKADSDRPDGE